MTARDFEPYMLFTYAALAEVVHRTSRPLAITPNLCRQTTATGVVRGSIGSTRLTLAAVIA